jgi:hypothetical protein
MSTKTTTTASAPATTTTAAPTTASPSVGLSALVAQLSAALDAAEAQLGPDAPAYTSGEKKRTAKPRKGSDKVVAQLAPIVDQYKLNSDSLNTTQMLAQYTLAQTLLPLQIRLQKVTKRVDDEVFDAQTGSWTMALQLYSLLARRAKTDGNVAASIAPLVKTFSYRHPEALKQGKEATRLAANLKKTLAVANKHGVTVAVAPDGTVQEVKGHPAAVVAAQAELATQGVTLPAASTLPPAATVSSAVNAGAGTAAPTAGAAATVAQTATPAPPPAATSSATPLVTGH